MLLMAWKATKTLKYTVSRNSQVPQYCTVQYMIKRSVFCYSLKEANSPITYHPLRLVQRKEKNKLHKLVSIWEGETNKAKTVVVAKFS